MSRHWIDSVKHSRKLTVYNNLQANWSGIFQPCIAEFNRLLGASGAGIRFEVSTSSDLANVVAGSGNGAVSFEFQGQTYNRTFNGNQLHGATYQLSIDDRIEKAYVFIPGCPQINTPGGIRATGILVVKTILLHEFVHACGLQNSDHSTDDLFMGFPQTNPGSRADQDNVGVQTSNGYTWFPPFFLSAGTRGKIQSVW